MTLAETILIIVITSVSVFITFKGMKTAIIDIAKFIHWFVSKVSETLSLIQGRETTEPSTTLGKLIARSKSTLLPFIGRTEYQQVSRRRLIGMGYLVMFIIGLFLIITLFWAFLTADLDVVLANSPYLLGSIKNLLSTYQGVTVTISVLFIIGFIIEVVNSIRSMVS